MLSFPGSSLRALVFLLCPVMGACTFTGDLGDYELVDQNFGGLLEGGLAPASGVRIREIAVYQGVKRTLMERGAAVASDIPLIAGRDALIRVFFETDAAYNGAPVTARVEIGGKTLLDVIKPLSGEGRDEDLESTLNFDVPASAMTDSASLRVGLLQPTEQEQGSSPDAVYQVKSLGVSSVDASLRIRLVPIVYTADGSDRLPDTSPEQLRRIRDRFQAMYPVSSVELDVHAPARFDIAVGPTTGWDDLLDGLAKLRSDEGADDDLYYYGLFTPAPTFEAYCTGSCNVGLGYVAKLQNAHSRVAIGLGYSGDTAVDTAVHEIGHNHGRKHAPCGVVDLPAKVDQGFPYPDGRIGVFGYDLLNEQLLDPSTSDVMGYCSPKWVSDYTYKALFERIRAVSGAAASIQGKTPVRYERMRIDAKGGAAALLPSVTLGTPPEGLPVPVILDAAAGSEQVIGQLVPYDHMDGGVVLVPSPGRPIRSLRMELHGKVITAPVE